MKLLQNKTNVEAPTVAFPYGKSKDNTGTNNGTPVDVERFNDWDQFFERLFDKSGLTANGLLDSADNGFQLFEAFMNNIPKKFVKEKSTVFDNDEFTITNSEITAAFGGVNPFYTGGYSGSSGPEKCDFNISVWFLDSGFWYNLPITGHTPGGAYFRVDESTGDITVNLDLPAVDPAVRCRIVIVG